MVGHQNESFSCAICKAEISDLQCFEQHLKNVHSKEYYFWCKDCAIAFRSIDALVNHIEIGECTKNNIYNFRCSLESCSFDSDDPAKFCYHFKNMHKGKNIIKCYFCTKIFSIPHFLVLHMQCECDKRPSHWPAEIPATSQKRTYRASSNTSTQPTIRPAVTTISPLVTDNNCDNPDDPTPSTNTAYSSANISLAKAENSSNSKRNIIDETKKSGGKSKRGKNQIIYHSSDSEYDSDIGWVAEKDKEDIVVATSDRVLRKRSCNTKKVFQEEYDEDDEVDQPQKTRKIKKEAEQLVNFEESYQFKEIKSERLSPIPADDDDDDNNELTENISLNLQPTVQCIKTESEIDTYPVANGPWLKHWNEWRETFMDKKSSQSLSFLICSSKLSHFFKCMQKTCIFTTNEEAVFKMHCQARHRHKNVVCTYCLESLPYGELISHIVEVHGNRHYQCSKCLYRAISSDHLTIHIEQFHAAKDAEILYAPVTGNGNSHNIEDFNTDLFLRLICKFDFCSFNTLNMKEFCAHGKSIHAAERIYSCSFCCNKFPSSETLVTHLCKHDIYNYQCYFCTYGSNKCQGVLNHICLNHPDKPLRYFDRTE